MTFAPLRTTLFPYTTLFRSASAGSAVFATGPTPGAAAAVANRGAVPFAGPLTCPTAVACGSVAHGRPWLSAFPVRRGVGFVVAAARRGGVAGARCVPAGRDYRKYAAAWFDIAGPGRPVGGFHSVAPQAPPARPRRTEWVPEHRPQSRQY